MLNRYRHYYARTFSSHTATHRIRLTVCALLQSCLILQSVTAFQIPDKRRGETSPASLAIQSLSNQGSSAMIHSPAHILEHSCAKQNTHLLLNASFQRYRSVWEK